MAGMIRMEAEIAPLDMMLKPFSTIGHDWMLITAGSGLAREQWNTMTASWGSFGVFWNKRTVTCVIRPTRHTFEFVERESLVTFSFFDSAMKKALQVCGSTSGAETDKAEAAGITPMLLESGAVGFAEAKLNLVCRKIFAQDIDPASFIDASLEKNYPEKDYHRMYICEILRAYRNETKEY
jgi:flavin reductase (DIM6/NTAB) family NADH-FMN oxidoreductase RutF